MAYQIDIESPETGGQVGRTFTATGTVWNDAELGGPHPTEANVECTLSGAGGTYTNISEIELPAGGASVPWAVSLPSGTGQQIAVGTYTLVAVLKVTNPPSDQEDNIQVA